MTWFHRQDRPDEPEVRDYIRLLDLLGEPSQKVVRIKQVIANDPREELWEVIDEYNQTRIITESEDGWLEVNLEE